MKERIKRILKNKYFIGSFIVTFIYGIMLVNGKVFPFGKNTILVGDLSAQYIHFFCYLKNILLGNKGIFMSWNLGMANGFYTNFIYYLLNPINLLVLFFNNSNMFIFVEIILYIKLLLIFNCFTLYIEKVFNYNKINSILFGIAYTFSSFVIIYYFNIMWLDVLYVLPISILFIDNYIKTGKIYPIILSYLYILFVQYYMAYSMIIFCSIYYVIMYMLQENITKGSIKKFMKKTIILAIATILVVGVAMIIYVPTLSSMNQITDLNEQHINTEKLNLTDFLNNFMNYFDYDTTQNVGFAFCGSLMTILMILFFINKNITIKEKIIFGYLLVFLSLPIISPEMYRIWHGGASTHGFNYRYGYLIIFILTTIAFKSYKELENNTKKHFVLLFVFFGIIELLKILYFFSLPGFEKRYDYLLKLVISIIIIFIDITIIMWIGTNKVKKRKIQYIMFVTCIIIEIIDICLVIRYNMGYDVNIDYYNKDNKMISYVVDQIKVPEIDRIVLDNDEYGNNSLKYNYSSFTFFSSGRNIETLKNMNQIGYTTNYVGIDNKSKTLVTDIMSGVKYYLLESNSKENIKYNDNYNNLLEHVEKYDNKYDLYKNNYAFPFAYCIQDNLNILEDDNIFDTQNRILNNYGKESNEIFLYNIKDSNSILKYDKKKIDKKTNEVFNGIIQYRGKAIKDTDIYIKYSNDKIPVIIKADKKNEIFLGDTKLYNQIAQKEIINRYYAKYRISHIVSLKKGEEFTIDIEINKKDFNEEDLDIYCFDSEKIKNKIKSVNQDIFQLNKIKKDGLDGTIDLKEDGFVCFEIAYDEGWHIEIDGKRVESQAIYNVFLGANIKKGQHNIKVYFIPKGFIGGAIISTFSGLALIILLVIYRKKREIFNK